MKNTKPEVKIFNYELLVLCSVLVFSVILCCVFRLLLFLKLQLLLTVTLLCGLIYKDRQIHLVKIKT